MKSFVRATPYCTNRAEEWISALIMVFIGIGVPVIGHALHLTTVGAFREFAKFNLGYSTTSFIFLAVGAVHMVALRRNGGWKRGPLIRALCALMGVLLWSTLLFGVVDILIVNADFFISMFAWAGLLCASMHSFARALLDEKPSKVKPDGNAGIC